MRIEHIKLFVRVANLCNFSSAGDELGLSAAVVSAQISKLERDLGTRLLHRTTRKVSLTEDGMAFLPYAEDLLANADAARAAVGMGNSSPSGTLRLSVPASLGRMHMMPAMHGFMDTYPNIKVDCRFSDSIVDLVEGGFDIAIRNAKLESSSLIARKLASDHRVLCASPGYIKTFGEPKGPKDLSGHQCIVLSGMDTWQFKSGTDVLNVKVTGRFKTDSGEAVREACVQGFGISINSMWSAYRELQSGKLIRILEAHPLVTETAIWAVYPSSRQLAPKVRAFIDYFSEIFSHDTDWYTKPK